MADTPALGLNRPTIGGSNNAWGTDWNENADILDQVVGNPQVLAKSADYTVVAADNGAWIDVTTGASNVTVTLTALATLGSRFSVGVRKVDTGAGKIIIARSASDTIDGNTAFHMLKAGDAVLLRGSGSAWKSIARMIAPNYHRFPASGTYTKTLGVKHARVRVVGGGGAGGGSQNNTAANASCGSGGGSGGFCDSWIDGASLGTTEAVTIGAAGTPANGNDGGNGGNTTFGSHLAGSGGTGGTTAATGSARGNVAAGAGGTATITTGTGVAVAGQRGGNGYRVAGDSVWGGEGGSTPLGNGGAEQGGINVDGYDATGFGAGGGGATSVGAVGANPGGAGMGGFCDVVEFF